MLLVNYSNMPSPPKTCVVRAYNTPFDSTCGKTELNLEF